MTAISTSTLKADWEDMVFENREHGYGAYDLRKSYPRHLLISTAMAVGLGCCLWLLAKASPALDPILVKTDTLVDLSLAAPPPFEEAKEVLAPPPPPPPAPQLKQLAFQIPDPTPADELSPEDAAATPS